MDSTHIDYTGEGAVFSTFHFWKTVSLFQSFTGPNLTLWHSSAVTSACEDVLYLNGLSETQSFAFKFSNCRKFDPQDGDWICAEAADVPAAWLLITSHYPLHLIASYCSNLKDIAHQGRTTMD
jgi:hypothetical protein